MFALNALAMTRLESEGVMTAEAFLGALPPFAKNMVRRVRLFGPHAREFEPEVDFELLVEVDARTVEVRTAVAIAASAVAEQALPRIAPTLVTPFEKTNATGVLARTLQSAEREGLDLWVRPDEEERRAG